ncbi:chromate transporter [Hymenobacter sp.]|uniref:chromate transporter n=1 Tax=Hymenobacter sp. TaxID=1898978 RepID=UPI002EDAACE3
MRPIQSSTVTLIGYLVAGLPGACMAALATILPCFVLTVVPALYFKRYGQYPAIKLSWRASPRPPLKP